MFEQSLVNGARTKTKWGVLVSFTAQSVLIAIAALVPLIYTSPLPARQWMSAMIAPPPSGPQPRVSQPDQVQPAVRPRMEQAVLTAPATIPRKVAILNDDEMPAPAAPISSAADGVQGGLPGGGSTGVIAELLSAARPVTAPPPVEAPKPVPKQAVLVGGKVQQAKQIYAPLPVYPPLAKQTGISGLVRLSAIIAADGTVEELKVISGHPWLVAAALEAVARWRYRPTLLNGEPVQVITQIDVNFTLSR